VLLAIDPGESSGWAIFFKGMLIACGLNGEPSPLPPKLDLLVIEEPRIYPGGRTRRPADIMKVQASAHHWRGKLEARCAEVRMIAPRTWKGTIDGDIVCARTLAKLDPGERQVFDDAMHGVAKRKQHNVLDAIGLGLWVSGRK